MLFFIFLVIPLIETFIFIKMASIIGLASSFAITILTAIIGSYILKIKSLETFNQMRVNFSKGEIPSFELFSAALFFLSGGLLLTPGFLTDIIGFLILNDLVRKYIYNIVKTFVLNSNSFTIFNNKSSDKDTIDGEYKNLDN